MPNVACRDNRAYSFEPRRTALLAIDFQRDFLDPEGFCVRRLGEDVTAMRAILPAARRILEAARRGGLHVIHTREGYRPDLGDMNALKRERSISGTPGPLGRFLVQGEPGQAIIPEMAPLAGEPAFDKPGFSAFFRSPLEELLRERDVTHLMVMGVTTQCCVHSTIRAAVDLGYWCLTIEDACAALRPAWHQAAMDLIASENHLFGWVADTDGVVAALS
ncbi:MAG: cysteine hydrolase [Alphaproteobacteria bacterium]|nr:cysteine hydrolase [Alphaproteobacteria bacterium]